MLGALKLSAPPPAADTLTRYAIKVETRAQAQAIQTFLWCLWLSALHQTRSGYATEVKHATTGQSYWKVDVGGRNAKFSQAVAIDQEKP